MKTLITLLLLSLLSLPVQANDCGLNLWNEMAIDQRAELLYDLDYFASDLPECLSALSYEDLKLAAHKEYAEQIIAKFHDSVDREGIEQSDFIVETDPELNYLYVLVSDQGVILGGIVSFFQEGLDEEGNEGDISWSATVRFDSTGDLLTDENGTGFEDLYYEWSGH